MKTIARRTSWVAIACGLACGSAEPSQPARVVGDLDPSPANAGLPPSPDSPTRVPGARAFDPDPFEPGAVDWGSFASGASPTRGEQLDALISPLLASGSLEGVSIALVSDGLVETYGYGAVREGGPVPDGRTLFEIGSITKTFTSLLLADLVRDGRVELDQPVASLLPEGVSVPELDGRAITLLDLATHTSGLPRLPADFFPAEPTSEQLLDPYADYQVEDLYAFLSGYTLPVVPGERFEYSNVGSGLLGHALSFAAGASFEEAIEQRISAPLGMPDTTLHPSAEQVQRLAVGHDENLAPVPGWAFTPALEGAGALRSSAEDMGQFIAAELAASAPAEAGSFSATLLESMALTQIPQRATDSEEPIGLAWFFSGPDILLHDGATGGFSSFSLMDRASGVGVVVLVNTATSVTGSLGVQLYQLLLGSTPAPAN